MTLEDIIIFQMYGIKGYNEINDDMSGKGKEAADTGELECEGTTIEE